MARQSKAQIRLQEMVAAAQKELAAIDKDIEALNVKRTFAEAKVLGLQDAMAAFAPVDAENEKETTPPSAAGGNEAGEPAS